MSSPSQPSGSSSYGATRLSASSSNAAAATTSLGSSASYGSGFSSRSCSAIFPPTRTRVRPLPEVHEHAELVVDLRAARDEHERPLDVAEEPPEHLELLLEEQPGVRGQQVRDALGRRVRAMRGAERVVHVQIHPLGQPLRRLRVVRRLARVEARVLEHRDAVVVERARAAAPRRAPSRTPDPGPSAGRGASRRRRAPPPRSSRIAQRRQGRADARVVGDLAVLERDVQVGADEDALAGDVRVADRARPVHPYGSSLPITSTSRHE